MEFFFTLMIAGISVGAIYALVAVGLTLTYWTTRTLNFGQSALMMAPAMMTAALVSYGVSVVLAVVLALLAAGTMGLIVERIGIRPALVAGGALGWVIATLGLGTVVQGVTGWLTDHQPVSFPELWFKSSDFIMLGEIAISVQYLLLLCFTIIIISALDVFMRFTLYGQTMRAVAIDSELARVQGIPVNRIIVGSFVASSVLAAATGLLVAQIDGGLGAAFGFDLVLLGFVAAVIGGIGSLWGCLVGGFGVGILSKLAGGYILPSSEQGAAFLLLMLVLVLRPNGLFGREAVSKV